MSFLDRTLCECGCGELTNPGNRFIRWHHSRVRSDLTREKLSKSKKRGSPSQEVICNKCGIIFVKEFCRITEKNYCSRSCSSPILKKELPCHGCGKSIFCTPWQIRTRKNNFCSRKCLYENPLPVSEDQKKKISDTMKKRWAEGVKNNKNSKRYSKQEERLAPVMNSLGYKWNVEHPKHIICEDRTRIPDFYNDNTKEIIEVWGYWWHRDAVLSNGRQHESLEYVIEQYALVGWTCKVMWEDEFEEFCRKVIECF
jgi:hypothetical protein